MPKVDSLDALVELLTLEKIEENIFRGDTEDDVGSGNVFGGQVLGQALAAAYRTVAGDRLCHSLHAYFLRPGDLKSKIIYDIDRIRDGKSFTTRRVRAIQKGEVIFNMSASFQVPEDGMEHDASRMPDILPPEQLQDEVALRRSVADKIAEPYRKRFTREKPIEVRPLHQDAEFDFTRKKLREPRNYYWLRAKGDLPNVQSLHQSILAYASDMGLMGTALNPHNIGFGMPGFQAASIDHAMYFHSEFNIDQWLLYATDSPRAINSRGFNRGQVFSHDGTLVATAFQEGLMRIRKSKSTVVV